MKMWRGTLGILIFTFCHPRTPWNLIWEKFPLFLFDSVPGWKEKGSCNCNEESLRSPGPSIKSFRIYEYRYHKYTWYIHSLSVEKTNEKINSSIWLLHSNRNVPNTIWKYHFPRIWYFCVAFGTFLLLGKSDWANSFSIGLVFVSWYYQADRFWYPYIKFTTTLIFDPTMGKSRFSNGRAGFFQH